MPVSSSVLVRTLYGLSAQPTIGVAFSANLDSVPRPGQFWIIQHLSVELVNYASGLVTAALSVGGRFVASSNQGQHDTFDAGSTIVRVNPSELVTVTWNATRVTTLVKGRVIATVAQYGVGR